MAGDTPKTSFNADVVDAHKGIMQPCTVETDTHKFVVQTNPDLIVAVNKETGEEAQHSDPKAVSDIWLAIKEFVSKELAALEGQEGTQKVDDDAA